MLILSRKINQRIVIGDNIEIVILDIKDGQVRVGIDAPQDVPVFREELYKDIRAENKEATILVVQPQLPNLNI